MPKYLYQAKYTNEGLKGLLKEGGTARKEAIEKAFVSVGGKVESIHWAFGCTDLFIICDVPDNVTAAGASFAANISGAATTKVTVLLTPEEIDSAVKLSPDYRPPGK